MAILKFLKDETGVISKNGEYDHYAPGDQYAPGKEYYFSPSMIDILNKIDSSIEDYSWDYYKNFYIIYENKISEYWVNPEPFTDVLMIKDIIKL